MTSLRDRLIDWLISNGYAEPEQGYGHVTAEALADALMEEGWVEE